MYLYSFDELSKLSDDEAKEFGFLTVRLNVQVSFDVLALKLMRTTKVDKIVTRVGLIDVAERLMREIVNVNSKRYNVYLDPEISDFEFSLT